MYSSRWSSIGLFLLALVTLAVVVLALLHYRGPLLQPNSAVPASGGSVVATTPAIPDATRTPTPASTLTATTSATALRAARPSSISAIKDLLSGSDPVTVVVLGDGTGVDEPGGTTRWVSLWARASATERPVRVHSLTDSGGYAEPATLGSGSGSPIEVYNASSRGVRIEQMLPRVPELVPADADLVILSFAHNESATDLPARLTSLHQALPTGAMVLVMLQNPESGAGQRAQIVRTQAVADWARATELPTVDVHQAFFSAPQALANLLGTDGMTPNAAGSQVWRDAVVAALA